MGDPLAQRVCAYESRAPIYVLVREYGHLVKRRGGVRMPRRPAPATRAAR
jgi:hypothetical protein